MYEDIILILKSKNKQYFVFRSIKYALVKFINVLVQTVLMFLIAVPCSFSFVGGRRTHRIRTVTVSTYVFGADSQSVHFRLQNFGAIPQQCKAYLVFLDYMCPSKKLISWKSNCGMWFHWRRSGWKKYAMTECKWIYNISANGDELEMPKPFCSNAIGNGLKSAWMFWEDLFVSVSYAAWIKSDWIGI